MILLRFRIFQLIYNVNEMMAIYDEILYEFHRI